MRIGRPVEVPMTADLQTDDSGPPGDSDEVIKANDRRLGAETSEVRQRQFSNSHRSAFSVCNCRLPRRRMTALLGQLQTGSLAVQVKHPLLEKSANRLAYGLCASALLLTSAMLSVHQVAPTIRGVSI